MGDVNQRHLFRMRFHCPSYPNSRHPIPDTSIQIHRHKTVSWLHVTHSIMSEIRHNLSDSHVIRCSYNCDVRPYQRMRTEPRPAITPHSRAAKDELARLKGVGFSDGPGGSDPLKDAVMVRSEGKMIELVFWKDGVATAHSLTRQSEWYVLCRIIRCSRTQMDRLKPKLMNNCGALLEVSSTDVVSRFLRTHFSLLPVCAIVDRSPVIVRSGSTVKCPSSS